MTFSMDCVRLLGGNRGARHGLCCCCCYRRYPIRNTSRLAPRGECFTSVARAPWSMRNDSRSQVPRASIVPNFISEILQSREGVSTATRHHLAKSGERRSMGSGPKSLVITRPVDSAKKEHFFAGLFDIATTSVYVPLRKSGKLQMVECPQCGYSRLVENRTQHVRERRQCARLLGMPLDCARS
jgi:hypothetical protein